MSSYYLSRQLAVLAAAVALSASAQANAQVPGTFNPSVYGDTAVAPLPVRVELPPGTPFVKGKAIQLREEILESRRPYISSVFSYSNEPLDSRDNKLTTVTPGLEVGFWTKENTQVQLNYLPTIFGPGKPTIAGEEWRATVRSQPTNRFRYVTSAGLFHTFNHVKPGIALVGNVGASYALHDRLRVSAEYRRDIVGDSRLSATGLDLKGSNLLVGRVKRNRFSVGISTRPTSRTDLDFRYSLGFDQGYRIQPNIFNEFSLRAGHTLVARDRQSHLALLQPSYQFLAMGFRHDLSQFGNLTFTPSDDFFVNAARGITSAYGQPQIPLGPGERRAGVGGYFSPQIFYLHSFRLDAAGRVAGPVFYRIGGSVGLQDFRDTFNNLGHPTLVGTANASLNTRINRHWSVEQGWYILQASNTYQRNVIYNVVKYTF